MMLTDKFGVKTACMLDKGEKLFITIVGGKTPRLIDIGAKLLIAKVGVKLLAC